MSDGSTGNGADEVPGAALPARYAGRAALVTGAGSGMGRAITRRLAAEGAQVLAVEVDEARLDALDADTPASVRTHRADVGDPSQCAAAVAAAVDAFGRLDVLGNVAGIFRAGHLADISDDEYRRVLAVNLDGPFFLARAAIPHLLEVGGNIVNIASNSGIHGIPYAVPYSMSKGGVIQLTRALAVEFLKQPLRVNAIAPAGTNTNIASGTQFPADADVGLLTRMAGHRGMTEPEEVAALFAFLASDEARSVNGAVYVIDNGLTIS